MRTKPTVVIDGEVYKPRDHGAHGKTLALRYIAGPSVRAVHENDKRPRDRSLPGKARIRARKAATA